VLSEEAKDPKKTIGRATHWAVFLPGLLCGASAFAMSTNAGDIVGAARADTTNLVFNLVTPYVPEALVNIGYILFLTSVFAAMLAFHTSVTRYQFALGRERVLPRIYGSAHPRTGAPIAGSITQSVLALGVLIVYFVTHTDPLVHLFAWMTVVGGLGVLILMWATSAAVIGFFVRNRRRENVWRARIAPMLAFLLLTAVLAATVIGLGQLLQVPADSPFNWLFPTVYALCALFGIGWAAIMRGSRPDAYAGIGRGTEGFVAAESVFGRPTRPHRVTADVAHHAA